MTGRGLAIAAAAGLLASCATGDDGFEREYIVIVGSSTVFPFTRAVASAFARENPEMGAPTVESTGTGAGIERFCAGLGGDTPDILDASRRMTESERALCEANGVTDIVEIQLGLEGVAIARAPTGEVAALSSKDLYEAIAAMPYGEPNRAQNWSDVNPALPDRPILVYGPPETSGTRDSFEELMLQSGCHSDPEMAALAESAPERHARLCRTIREDGKYQESGEDDERMTQMVIVNPGAVIVVGFNYVERNEGRVVDVPIDGVAASRETIASGDYPAARPLYLYVKRVHVAQLPALADFVAEYVSVIGADGYLAERGLVPSNQATIAAARRAAASLETATATAD